MLAFAATEGSSSCGHCGCFSPLFAADMSTGARFDIDQVTIVNENNKRPAVIEAFGMPSRKKRKARISANQRLRLQRYFSSSCRCKRSCGIRAQAPSSKQRTLDALLQPQWFHDVKALSDVSAKHIANAYHVEEKACEKRTCRSEFVFLLPLFCFG